MNKNNGKWLNVTTTLIAGIVASHALDVKGTDSSVKNEVVSALSSFDVKAEPLFLQAAACSTHTGGRS